MASSIQLTVDGDCDCLMQESTDVVLCLSDGWEEKTLNGTKFVLGTIVSVNEKCTNIKKGNCYYPGVKSCEYIVDVLTNQFEPIDPDNEDSAVWEPDDDDVESVTKSNCFYSTIIDTLITHSRISDDEQNLLTPLPDGLFIPQATIVRAENSQVETDLPIEVSVSITNPSEYLPMMVFGLVRVYLTTIMAASASARYVRLQISAIDEDSTVHDLFGSPISLGSPTNSPTAIINGIFFVTFDFGTFDDAQVILNPGESRTYNAIVTADSWVVGDSLTGAGGSVYISLTGINYSPL